MKIDLIVALITFVSPLLANGASNRMLTITSPANNTSASGTIQIKGAVGSAWANVAAYDVNYNKIASDARPSQGHYTLTANTTQLPNGSDLIRVIAFSAPSGRSGGSSTEIDVTVNVNNVTASPSPTVTATASPSPTVAPTPTPSSSGSASYPLEPTTAIIGCDNTGATDVTSCISNFISKHAGPAFYLAAGTYTVSNQIIIVSKRLYGNKSTASPTRLVAAKGAHASALQLEGTSSGMDWIEFDADNSAARSGQPVDDCINIDGATGTSANPVFITNSTFKNCSAAGIFNNDWDIGPSNWVVIAGNWVYNSAADCVHNSTYNSVPIKNLLVEYNLLEGCGDDGVAVGAYSSANPTTNIMVQYNTVKNQNSAQGVSEWIPCSSVGACVVQNNYMYQEQGYVSTVTGSTDSSACIMLEAAPAWGGIGPSSWVNQNNDCINRGGMGGAGNYMMWNGSGFAAFGYNSFLGNTSKDAHLDCIDIQGSPHTDETVANNFCANPGPDGSVVYDTSGTGQVHQSGNVQITDAQYKAINSPGGGPGTDPNYP
jgi:hypothetical protein